MDWLRCSTVWIRTNNFMKLFAVFVSAVCLAFAFAPFGTPVRAKNNLQSIEKNALIVGREGFRSIPYVCAGGKSTIGYGTRARELRYVTKETAMALLEQHLDREVRPHIPETPHINSLHKKQALESLIYNIGSGAWNRSRLKRAIIAGESREVIEREWREFRLVQGVPNAWLSEWREKEIELYFYEGE